MKKCVVIYNPESGYKKNKIDLNYIQSTLKQYNYNTTFIQTKKKGDAKEIVERIDKADLVICAGGDGTLNEAVNGNLQRDTKLLLSHLPIGTVTDIGKLYGFTKNSEEDLNLMLNGDKKNIDICLINNNPFIYVACFGDYTNISYDTPRNFKKKFGRFGYILYALKNIAKKIKRYNIKYVIDGKEFEGKFSFIFVTNTSRVGGIDNIYDDVKLDDNMFEVALCDVKTKGRLLKTFYEIKTKDIRDVSNIKYYRTNNLKIIFDSVPSKSWCIDGEEMKHHSNEFTFSIDKSCYMLLPKVNVPKLFENVDED